MEAGRSNIATVPDAHPDPTTPPRRTAHAILTKVPTIDSGSGVSSGDDGDDIRDLRCCFSSCHIRTGTVVIALLESLLLFHAVIYLAVNLAAGDKRYASLIPDFAQVVKYEYFVPMIVLQSLWIIGNIVAVFAVKYVSPGLMLVHIILRTPAVIANLIIAILFIVNASSLSWPEPETVNWALVVTLTAYGIVTVMTIYFTYVTWMCMKHLKFFKKIIAVQRFWIEAPIGGSHLESARGSYDNRSITPLQHCIQGNHNYETTVEIEKRQSPPIQHY